MKSVSFEHVRKELSEIANEVKYGNENYILTKNNKPFVGIVPVEMIYLVKELLAASKKNKDLSKIIEHYALHITDEDLLFLQNLEKQPGKLNARAKKAFSSIKGKISNI
ncbi:MAG: hypothetical protein U1E78_12195 [Gammaproteobacteria bacterium]